jgi:hypothetical protein
LVAYVVTRNGSSLGIDEVRRYLADKLPDYMIPTALVVLESFPLTPNGKLDRNALPAPAASRPYVAPGTALERTLAELWQGVVGGSPVGLDDSFFEIGGNSLRMAQVHGLIREQLQRDVPITRLFQFPTIRALAAFLEKPAARPAGRLQRVALRAQQMKGLADVGD